MFENTRSDVKKCCVEITEKKEKQYVRANHIYHIYPNQGHLPTKVTHVIDVTDEK